MQAEEIIQKKEWQELNAEERVFLEPLAQDEQEFNLLKKMLLVAAEEAAETPALDPAVQHRLREALIQKPQRYSIKKWQYAAAAVILLALCTWLLLQPKHAQKDIVHKRAVPEKQPGTIHPQVSPDTPGTTTTPPVLVKQTPGKSRKKATAPGQQPGPSLRDIAAINTSVRENTALLELITEVYE